MTVSKRMWNPSSRVGWEEYDDFDRHGTSKYTRYLRLGRGRWRFEGSLSGFALMLGPVVFSAGFEWADA
jgi:hypothetical protein